MTLVAVLALIAGGLLVYAAWHNYSVAGLALGRTVRNG